MQQNEQINELKQRQNIYFNTTSNTEPFNIPLPLLYYCSAQKASAESGFGQ